MRTATFQTVARRYAAVMGRNDRVYLTFGGQSAYTDGRRVNLPALPAGTTMTPHQARVMGGYLDHETGHVRFTDFRTMEEEKSFLEDPANHYIWNVIEDVWMENEQIKMYPGSRGYLDDLHLECEKTGREKELEIPDTKASRLLKVMFHYAYSEFRNAPFSSEETLLQEGKLGMEIKKVLDRRMKKARSTKDNIQTAKEIKEILKEEIKKDQESADRVMRQVMSTLSMGEGDGSMPPTPGPGDKLTEDELKIAATLLEEIKERANAFTKLMEEVKQKNAQDLPPTGKHSGYRRMDWKGGAILPPATTEYDRIFVPSNRDRKSLEREKGKMSAEIRAVKKMARIYLQSRSHAAWSRGLEEGQLDQEELHNLFLGDRSVYKEMRTRALIDTAILLLLDLSTSMSASMVRSTAILLSEALAPIPNLPLCIAGFSTNSRGYGRYDATKGTAGIGRTDGLEILQFKSFDEPYGKAADRLGAITTIGSTPLGDAYGHGFEHLVNRKEKRRILWIVSDGEPAINVLDQSHNEYLLMEKVHRSCKRLGVEVWGLGIAPKNVNLRLKPYVDRFAQIEDYQQLPESVLTSVREITK